MCSRLAGLQASGAVPCLCFPSCHRSEGIADKPSNHVQLRDFVVTWATRLEVLYILPVEPFFFRNVFLLRFRFFSQIIATFKL